MIKIKQTTNTQSVQVQPFKRTSLAFALVALIGGGAQSVYAASACTTPAASNLFTLPATAAGLGSDYTPLGAVLADGGVLFDQHIAFVSGDWAGGIPSWATAVFLEQKGFGGADNRWIYSNGNTDAGEKVIFQQTLNGLVAGEEYVFTVNISNVFKPGERATHVPVVQLSVNGELSDKVNVEYERDAIGNPTLDVWTPISVGFTAPASGSVDVVLTDFHVSSGSGDDLGVAGITVSACEGGATPPPVADKVSISGTVNLDGSLLEDKLVTLSNGDTTLTDSNGAYSFTNLDSGAYTVDIAGDSVAPTTLTFTNNAATHDFVYQTSVGALEVSSPTLSNNTFDYGSPEIGSTPSQVFTITNSGTAPLIIGSVISTGALYAVTNTCESTTVPVAGTCTLTVTYSPTAVPTSANTGTVVIKDGGNTETLYTLNLTGLAQDSNSPEVEVGDGESGSGTGSYALPFDAIAVNSTPPVKSVKITNTGNANLIISSITVSGTVFTSVPGTTAISGACQVNQVILPNASCNLAYQMETSVVGSYTAVSTVTTNASPATFNVNLSGVVGDQDSDGDGLFDIVEADLGTDPNNPDSDADGVNDGDEVLKTRTDPLNSDTDGDGEKDGAEVGADVNAPLDNDGDSIIDALEPSNVDSDGDGLVNEIDSNDDGDELLTKNEAFDSLGNLKDKDRDTIPDYLERNDFDTDGDGRMNYDDPNDDNQGARTGPEGEAGSDYFRFPDLDNDGIPDHLDPDSTNIAGTTDGSGDSDQDGISDAEECPDSHPRCLNANDNKIPDYMENKETGLVPEAITPREEGVKTGVDGGVGSFGLSLISMFGLGFGLRRKFKGEKK